MKRSSYLVIIIIILTVLACGVAVLGNRLAEKEALSQKTEEPLATPAADNGGVTVRDGAGVMDDNASLYNYDRTGVTCMYVTVVEGSASAGTDHTFSEVNSYINTPGTVGAVQILADAIVKIGDENGPGEDQIGYYATSANATINVRGRTSTEAALKSYKIKLNDGAGLWNGQSTIALNKHPGDPTRLRNALYYRLLEEVPDMVSLRTYFVHLYICDKTSSGDGSDSYVDYGLYTAVEQPNNKFLKSHNIGKGGSFYKGYMCEFYRYEDVIRLATDPEYDEKAFSDVLEPKKTTDHSKLIEMLEAVNDYSVPIDKVIDKYFDAGNLTSYLAFNLLMLNPDSNAQNYYIYSPVNTDKWYFICWDGDGCLNYEECEILDRRWGEGEWSRGISDYWSVVLFSRMLREEKYRKLLDEKIEMLRGIITKEKISALVNEYRQVVDYFTHRGPDNLYLTCTYSQLEDIYASLPGQTELAYRFYRESLETPMPFFMDNVFEDEGRLEFYWDAAYDFDAELITYTFEISADYTFDSTVYSQETIYTQAYIDMLPEGTYYYRVTAKNTSGYTRYAFDSTEVSPGVYADGVLRFTVYADGSVIAG